MLPKRDTTTATAETSESSMVELLQALVAVPTRAGIDLYDEIFRLLSEWLGTHNVPCELLRDEQHRVIGAMGAIAGASGSPAYVVNACVDTASFGSLEDWRRSPTSAAVEDGWLFGRGSADCKAGVAIFCHLLSAFQSGGRQFQNSLGFVFDADEHSGSFNGIRAFVEKFQRPIAGVMIGYPGLDRIMTGARGFWRATLRVHGLAAHSGSSHQRGFNAVVKASRLIDALSELRDELAASNDTFPIQPGLTVTGVSGGGDFSMVPDRCKVEIDVRLTEDFRAEHAQARVHAIVRRIDLMMPSQAATEVVEHESWPAYRLAADSPLVDGLADGATQILGHRLPIEIAGASNVGNFLAQHGIKATCGLGVSYRNVHAANECVELASLETVYRIYEHALDRILATPYGGEP
jgi:succinyl-diaminopimelate desuccinylase